VDKGTESGRFKIQYSLIIRLTNSVYQRSCEVSQYQLFSWTRHSLTFMENEDSLHCSQEHAAGLNLTQFNLIHSHII
jgi:hypothetical protein